MRPRSRPLKAFHKSCGNHSPPAAFYLRQLFLPPPSLKAPVVSLVELDSKRAPVIISAVTCSRRAAPCLGSWGLCHCAARWAAWSPADSGGVRRSLLGKENSLVRTEGRHAAYHPIPAAWSHGRLMGGIWEQLKLIIPPQQESAVGWGVYFPRLTGQDWWIKRLRTYRGGR